MEGGTVWKTLDDVEIVIVATVDDREEPENIDVYMFPADEVRKRFDASYAARIQAGQTVKDDFGMWVALDRDDRGIPASVGTGIIERYKSIATYAIKDLIADEPEPATDDVEPADTVAVPKSLPTIAEVMAWARERVAQIAGVGIESVRLDLKIEY